MLSVVAHPQRFLDRRLKRLIIYIELDRNRRHVNLISALRQAKAAREWYNKPTAQKLLLLQRCTMNDDDDPKISFQYTPKYTSWAEGFARGVALAGVMILVAVIILVWLTAISPYR